MSSVSIGAASRESGVKVPTIRYYEDIGLVPKPKRLSNGRRVYDAKLVQHLSFIRHAREMDFSLEDIRTLLTLRDRPQTSCKDADDIALSRLADIDERITRLNALKTEIKAMVSSCGRREVGSCAVLATLAQP